MAQLAFMFHHILNHASFTHIYLSSAESLSFSLDLSLYLLSAPFTHVSLLPEEALSCWTFIDHVEQRAICTDILALLALIVNFFVLLPSDSSFDHGDLAKSFKLFVVLFQIIESACALACNCSLELELFWSLRLCVEELKNVKFGVRDVIRDLPIAICILVLSTSLCTQTA